MRHRSREIAFHLLFEAEYRLEEVKGNLAKEIHRYEKVHQVYDQETKQFALHLADGVLNHREELDALIVGAGSNWRLDRMGLIEKTILRIGVFEILFPDENGQTQPLEVVIDEAIELAKIYASDEAPAFINGILDAVAAQKAAVPSA